MMVEENCEKLLLVQAEFDGELDAAEAAQALRHRESCAICRGAYAELNATSRALRRDAPYYRAPEGLRRAVQRGFDPASARRPRLWWREGASFLAGAALAGTLAMLLLVAAPPSVLEQVVAGHVRALEPGHLEDIASSNEHNVKPWFDGRLDFAPPVKDLASADFPLTGGRLDYLDNRRVAALVYRHGQHVIDLFVWPASGTLAPETAAFHGYNAVHWSAGGMTFWAISDLERDQLQDFARLWRAAP
jgi:anti-sigma factor RsiW